MKLPLWMDSDFKKIFLEDYSLIDVRAPIEFNLGAIPGSVNLPILNDREREQVGTAYKVQGQDKAIELGHQFVSGTVKEDRVQQWTQFLQAHPKTILTCFRGGMRSQITQTWCAEAGILRPRVKGGYKALRQFLIDEIERFAATGKLIVVAGATGSGKTELLEELKSYQPVLDLEKYAKHRGSAFGGFGSPQPTQIDFENLLAVEMIRLSHLYKTETPFLIEDESRLIGRCVQPESLFKLLRSAPVVIVEESLEQRTENTFKEYITSSPLGSNLDSGDIEKGLQVFARYKTSLQNISKKLGGARTQEVMQDLLASEASYLHTRDLANNRIWIRKLLEWYYDPMYSSSLMGRNPEILFRGKKATCWLFLKQSVSNQKNWDGGAYENL